ncbi:MAG: LysR family transcriptional regulator, partial [Burkholderiaceae bacterium]
MRVFVRVAELSSFSAVAQQMGVARSVVTRQVAALEQHLGVKLMARRTRRLTLTSA